MYNDKDKRERITKTMLCEQLAKDVNRDIIGGTVGWAVAMVFCFLLYIWANAFTDSLRGGAVISVLLAAVPALVITAAIAHLLYQSVLRRRALKNGAFSVLEDRLERIDDNVPTGLPLLRSKHDYKDIFYFASGKKYVISSGENRGTRLDRTIDFSSAGDLFYLVVYDHQKDKPVRIYSGKIYRYDE